MVRHALPILFLTLALVSSCPPPAIPPSPAASALKAADLFDDLGPVQAFHVTVADADWAWLTSHATDEKYVPARLSWGAETVDSAAIRFKGAFGSLFSCFDATGKQTCPKLSMKVSFNEYDAKGRFHGLRKLVFNSCGRDPSYLHERLAYALFRDAGLVAPRAVHATLSINGGPPGLYLLVEDVDKEFLQDRFTQPDGNLYKEAWPSSEDPEYYRARLQTNEAVGNVSRMVAFAHALKTMPPGQFDAVTDPWIDRDAMMTYLVVDQMTDNWDGIWKFYCDGAGNCGNHNFYVYDPGKGRMTILPRDLDHTFTAPNADMARSWWDAGPDACKIVKASPLAGIRAPQCDPLLAGLMLGHWDAYLARLADLVGDGQALALSRQLERVDRYRAQILDAASNDPTGPTASEWRQAASRLRETLAAQQDEADAVLKWVHP